MDKLLTQEEKDFLTLQVLKGMNNNHFEGEVFDNDQNSYQWKLTDEGLAFDCLSINWGQRND